MNTILVVEDEQMLSDLMRDVLTQAGFKVVTAKDGIEGLDAFRNHHPDLILLDLMMPRLDGLGMLKEIRKEEEQSKRTRVVVLSSVDQQEPKLQAYANQVDDYLVKSNIEPKDVVEKVKKVLKKPSAP